MPGGYTPGITMVQLREQAIDLFQPQCIAAVIKVTAGKCSRPSDESFAGL